MTAFDAINGSLLYHISNRFVDNTCYYYINYNERELRIYGFNLRIQNVDHAQKPANV